MTKNKKWYDSIIAGGGTAILSVLILAIGVVMIPFILGAYILEGVNILKAKFKKLVK